VGFNTSDDAGVYRLTDDMALVSTADFITPPVNDPFVYGQIAAANAISDVYAMGGRPITCLNLVAFPSGKLAPEVLHRIVAGAVDKITEAGRCLSVATRSKTMSPNSVWPSMGSCTRTGSGPMPAHVPGMSWC
jgi:selenide,water dikinase